MMGSVLQVRGATSCAMPHVDAEGNVLCFNGVVPINLRVVKPAALQQAVRACTAATLLAQSDRSIQASVCCRRAVSWP